MVIAPREEGLLEKTAEETHLFPWYEHVGTHGIPKKDVSTNNELILLQGVNSLIPTGCLMSNRTSLSHAAGIKRVSSKPRLVDD